MEVSHEERKSNTAAQVYSQESPSRDPLSIVVAAHRRPPFLKQLLESIRCQSSQRWKLLVVGEPSDIESRDLVEAIGGRWLECSADRTVKRNVGADQAEGSYLLFIDSDMELGRKLVEECIIALNDADAVCIEERIPDGTYWSQARDFERRSAFGSVYFEAARAFRRQAFLELGGYDPKLTGLEDMDLQAALIRGRYRFGWVPDGLLHHEERVGLMAYLAKKSGRSPREFARKNPEYWKVLRSPLARGRLVLGSLLRRPLARNLVLIPGLVLMRLAELIARRSS